MKIKFKNSGEVPLDKYPVGTIILGKTEGEDWPYEVFWIEEIDGEIFLNNADDVCLPQEETGIWLFNWVALEVEE